MVDFQKPTNSISEVNKATGAGNLAGGSVGATPLGASELKILEALKKRYPERSVEELTKIIQAGQVAELLKSEDATEKFSIVDVLQTSETQKQPKPETSPSSQTFKSGAEFDLAGFEKLSEKEMLNKLASELVKNKFLYAKGSQNLPENWDPAEHTEEIQNVINEIKTKGAKVAEKLHLTLGAENLDSKKAISATMFALQVANSKETDFSTIKNTNPEAISNAIQEFILERKSKNLTSQTEENLMGLQITILDAKREGLIKAGVISPEDKLSPQELKKLCAENKINVGFSLKNHLEHKMKAGETLSQSEQIIYKKLKDINLEKLPGYLSRVGEQPQISKMLLADEKWSAKFAEAKTPEEKNKIYGEFIKEICKDPETGKFDRKKFKELRNDLAECGFDAQLGVDALTGLYRAAKKNSEMRKELTNDTNKMWVHTNTQNAEVFDREEKAKIAQHVNNMAQTDEEFAVNCVNNMYVSSQDEDKDVITKEFANSESQKMRHAATTNSLLIENEKTFESAMTHIKEHAVTSGDETEIIYVASHADEAPVQNQVAAIQISTEGSKAASEAAITSNVLQRLDKINQTGAFKIMQSRIEDEKLFENGTEAVNLGKKLADQIQYCDRSNQLDMHKSIVNSRYSEIAEHATKNISTYDESVQAQALRSSFEVAEKTGNTNLKDIACKQYSALAKSAKTEISENPALNSFIRQELLAYETRHPDSALTDYATYAQSDYELKNPKTAAKTTEETRKEKIEQYKEEFKHASISKKFRLLRKLQPSYQTKFFDYISTYAPGLFSSLLQSKGTDIFKLGLSMDAKNLAMREMLNNVDMRREALKYYKKYPNQFGESVKRLVENIMTPELSEDLNPTQNQDNMKFAGKTFLS